MEFRIEEVALLLLKGWKEKSEGEEEWEELLRCLLKGKYQNLLENSLVRKIISETVSTWNVNEERELNDREQFQHLITGIVCLMVFIQTNWTGPLPSSSIQSSLDEWKELMPSNLMNEMEVDGESIYSKTLALPFFFISHQILVKRIGELNQWKSAKWWSFRLLAKYQSLFSNDSNTIRELVVKRSNDLLEHPISNSELFTLLNLELGLFWSGDRRTSKSQKFIMAAKESSGLSTNLTGALGVRTKFQSFQVSQLILEAKSNKGGGETKQTTVPQEISLEDETYLDRAKLTEEVKNENLDPVDQAIILSLCLNVKNQNPDHGLTTEEMMPYVERVLEHPNNWMIHSMALYLKSRIQSTKDRIKEKAALQLQVLVDQFNEYTSVTLLQEEANTQKEQNQAKEEESHVVAQRGKYIFALAYPSFWDLKKELGNRFLSLGAAATALQLFEELEMWDDIIECYQVMGKNQKAEEVIREQLKVKPTPLLWCVLGDVTNDASHYETSWELSGKHFARAKRAHGRWCVKKNDWVGAIQHFEAALAINPLFSDAWFTVGCAFMREGQHQKAVTAFQRCVQISPLEGEAWNNMASALCELGKKREAFYPLQEAVKNVRHNWRIWENYLFVCMDLKEFQQAIVAVREILDLNDSVNVSVIQSLCKAVSANVTDSNGNEARESTKIPLEGLLQTISSKVTNNPALWKVFASYHMDIGENKKAIEFMEKQVRASKKPSWEMDEALFNEYASAVGTLVETYLEDNTSPSLFAAKSLLQSILKNQSVEDHFQFSETFHNLENLRDKVLIQAANNKK